MTQVVAQPARVLPKALRPGDLVAVVAPGARPEEAALEAGVEQLRNRGYRVRVGAHVLDRYGHMAGADRDRATDLMEAFLDTAVSGVFCARGGSGCSRTIPYLDLRAISGCPKVFVGYSDVTVLHLALTRYAGWPTFYGPMVATELDSTCSAGDPCGLWRIVSSCEPVGALAVGRLADTSGLNAGVAEGTLVGGTLCVIESAIGTDYALDTRERILALEDAQEPPWRVDRMLTHLSHAGVLGGAGGFVIGSLSEIGGDETGDLPVQQSLRDHLVPQNRPAVSGYPFGHIAQPVTLPLNCRVRLDAGARELSVLEPAVAD